MVAAAFAAIYARKAFLTQEASLKPLPRPFIYLDEHAAFLATKVWDDDASARVFDYGKLAFPFEQFEPSVAFASIVDVITGASPLFRNVVTPNLADSVREQSLEVWSRRSADGLGTRHPLVQKSYDMRPRDFRHARLTVWAARCGTGW